MSMKPLQRASMRIPHPLKFKLPQCGNFNFPASHTREHQHQHKKKPAATLVTARRNEIWENGKFKQQHTNWVLATNFEYLPRRWIHTGALNWNHRLTGAWGKKKSDNFAIRWGTTWPSSLLTEYPSKSLPSEFDTFFFSFFLLCKIHRHNVEPSCKKCTNVPNSVDTRSGTSWVIHRDVFFCVVLYYL